MKKVLTKGNVIVNEIEVGDIHYEFEYGIGIKTEVLEKPKRDESGYWSWKSKTVKTSTINKKDHMSITLDPGDVINYGAMEKYCYVGPNIYTNDAYGMFENRR